MKLVHIDIRAQMNWIRIRSLTSQIHKQTIKRYAATTLYLFLYKSTNISYALPSEQTIIPVSVTGLP